MSLETNVKLGLERLATIAKNLSNKQGDLSNLNTTATGNLVAAINELASSMVALNDSTTSTSTTYSSTKIEEKISAAITTALEGEDLSDLAAEITALAQADNGLLSFENSQSLSTAQKAQGQANLDAASKTIYDAFVLSIGNVNRDFVADIDAIYNA